MSVTDTLRTVANNAWGTVDTTREWLLKRRWTRRHYNLTPSVAATAVLAALALATLVYAWIVTSATQALVTAVVNADVLSASLDRAPTYPRSQYLDVPLQDRTDARGPVVDNLAVVLWLEQMRLVRPGTAYADILESPRFAALVRALATGNPLCTPEPTRQQLRLSTTERMIEIARYLSNHCVTTNAASFTAEVRSRLAGMIAGLDPAFDSRGELTFSGENTSFCMFGHAVGVKDQNAGCIRLFTPGPSEPPGMIVKRLLGSVRAYELSGGSPDNSGRNSADPLIKGNHDIHAAVRKALAGSVAALKPPTQLPGQRADAVEAAAAYQLALVAALGNDPDVAAARRWLSIWRGYEQYFILCLAFVAAALMIARQMAFARHRHAFRIALEELELVDPPPSGLGSIGDPEAAAAARRQRVQDARKAQARILSRISSLAGAANSPLPAVTLVSSALTDLESAQVAGLRDDRLAVRADALLKEIDSSRNALGWCITTLPAVGFLGTVHGILDALNNAGMIATGDAIERSAGLVAVTGSLGLAFATTLIALLFLIVLSFADTRQERAERRDVESLEEELYARLLA